MAGLPSLPNHIALQDGLRRFDLELLNGAKGITETSSSPSSIAVQNTAGLRYGDFSPEFSNIEQRDWSLGRGNENLVDNPQRFFDSQTLWSVTPNKIFPAPEWHFAKGLRLVDEYDPRPRNVSWKRLINTTRYIDIAFVAGQNNTVDKIFAWVRRRGSPGTLTVELCSDSAGNPNTVLQSATQTVTNITDTVSVLVQFALSASQALVSGTTYHVKLYGASGDSYTNHWEIGVDAGATGGLISTAGSSWATPSSGSTFKPFYRVEDADVPVKWSYFFLEGALYAVSISDTGANSKVYINGDRGTATSASSTTISDSNRTWTTNQWAGAMVRIIGGTGAKKGKGSGQAATIISNTGTQLTFAASDMPIAPDNTSRYVIYYTPYWTTSSIGTTGLGAVTDVAVLGSAAYFAQGPSVNMRKMVSSASTHTWSADGTNRADVLFAWHDPTAGPQMWRAQNDVVKVSTAVPATPLVFGTAVPVGKSDYLITNLVGNNGTLYALKEDSVWTVQAGRATKIDLGIDSLIDQQNGVAAASNGQYLFFNFWNSLEQMQGATVKDVGPWHGTGMPTNRSGKVSALVPMLAWLFAAVNGGSSGYSSVLMMMEDGSYHEVFRGWATGKTIRDMYAQPNQNKNPWLWIGINNEMVYQEYALSPLKESTFYYQHEAVAVSSTIDMGHTNLYKYFDSLGLDTENLDKNNIKIGVDYQCGADVNTNTWRPLKNISISPHEETDIRIGNQKKLRYRLRLQTNASATAPVVNGAVVKAIEIMPVKRVWHMKLKVSSVLTGNKHVNPDEFYEWVWIKAKQAGLVRMLTVFPTMQDVWVKLEPPKTEWAFINRKDKWTGEIDIVAREV